MTTPTPDRMTCAAAITAGLQAGRRCMRHARPGSAYCGLHQPATPEALIARGWRLATRPERGPLMDPRDTDPLVLIEDQERPLVTVPKRRSWLSVFADDWNHPAMDVYDAPRGVGHRRFAIVALVAGAFLAGIIVRSALATPRAAQLPAIPVADAAQPGVPPAAGVAQLAERRPPVGPAEVAGSTPVPGPDGTPLNSGIGSPLQGVQGLATWFCCTAGHRSGLYAAAGPALRVGHWRGRVVTVCAPASCVRVTLIDSCLCGHGRVVDLYPRAFRRLAPLGVGIVGVTVSWGGEPPATDTETTP